MLPSWQMAMLATLPAIAMIALRIYPTPKFIERLMLGEYEYRKRVLMARLVEARKRLNAAKNLEEKPKLDENDEILTMLENNDEQNMTVRQQNVRFKDRIGIIRCGVITSVTETTFTLDFTQEFRKLKITNLNEQAIHKGSVVQYLTYKPTTGLNERFIQFLKCAEESWDEDIDENELNAIFDKYSRQDVEIIGIPEEVIEAEVLNVSEDKSLYLRTHGGQMDIAGDLLGKIDEMPKAGDCTRLRLLILRTSPTLQLERDTLVDVLAASAISKAVFERSEVDAYEANKTKRWLDLECNTSIVYPYKEQVGFFYIKFVNNKTEDLEFLAVDIIMATTNTKAEHIVLADSERFKDGAFVIRGKTSETIKLIGNKSGATNRAKILLRFSFNKMTIERLIVEVFGKDEIEVFLRKPVIPNKDKLNAYYVLESGEKTASLPPPSTNRRFKGHQIHSYELPSRLKRAYFASGNLQCLQTWLVNEYKYIDEMLNMSNYSQLFSLLLHLEELDMFMEFRKYDLKNARFQIEGNLMSLNMKDLEKPNLVLSVGDGVLLENVFQYSGKPMDVEGSIFKVCKDRILIRFHDQFVANYKNEAYVVRFIFSRYCFRKMHHAIRLMAKAHHNHYLFPDFVVFHTVPQVEDVRLVGSSESNLMLKINGQYHFWYNENLNLFQKRAVSNILQGVSKLPYVIFGPPGTGKTMTIIETILQLLQNVPEARIIIATPSNSSADLIVSRLLKLMSHLQLLRVASHSAFERDIIPKELLKYCATIDIGIEGACHTETSVTSDLVSLRVGMSYMRKYSVIVGTCRTVGTLMQVNFPPDHFTHAIIDEAAQCLEPEVMCVLSLLGRNGQVILSGDPKQLPPIVMSRVASEYGLSLSYIERIMQFAPYSMDLDRHPSTNGYDNRFVTMLLFNYRSLPTLLNVYSSLFYGGNLRAVLSATNEPEYSFNSKGLEAIQDSCDGLENIDFEAKPTAMFCAVRGTNMQDDDSPSWFNILEAQQVYRIVLSLYAKEVNHDDIGVISLYAKQAQFIRNLFSGRENDVAPKVGSVEEFQGQERQIILITTVRTTTQLYGDNKRSELGFVSSPNRINVALSRSRALVVVIGDPEVLHTDTRWNNYMHYCHEIKSYFGDEPSLDSYLRVMGKAIDENKKIPIVK